MIATSCAINWLVPIIIMIAKADSPFIVRQAKESLNFQISVILWGLIGFLLCLTDFSIVVAVPLFVVLATFAVLMPIIAAISTPGGTDYRYPLTFRLIK